MDSAYQFYAYINQRMAIHKYSKYDAILEFINNPTISHDYKIIPQVEDELQDAIDKLNKNNKYYVETYQNK
jgi:hypothetical protein